MNIEKYRENRFFLKDTIRMQTDFSQTDQSLRLPPPLLQKPYPRDSVLIDLPEGSTALNRLAHMPLGEAMSERNSVRTYSDAHFTLEELSALLWAVQGVKKVLSPAAAQRTVPSAGARHSFETYLAVMRIESLEPGLYRYLPFEERLLQIRIDPRIGYKAADACLGQDFVSGAAVTFFWTTVPARMEWRYGQAAHKVIAVDAGHVCQNLYLAAGALGAGVCAIAAYDQQACDSLVDVDGEDEFTIYAAPAGKLWR